MKYASKIMNPTSCRHSCRGIEPDTSCAFSVSSPGRSSSKGSNDLFAMHLPLGRVSRTSLRARSTFSRRSVALEELCHRFSPGFCFGLATNCRSTTIPKIHVFRISYWSPSLVNVVRLHPLKIDFIPLQVFFLSFRICAFTGTFSGQTNRL